MCDRQTDRGINLNAIMTKVDKKCEKKVFDKSSHEEVCEVKLKSSNTVSCKVNETGSCDSQNYWNSIDSSSLRNVDYYCEKSKNLDSTSS